MKLIPFDGELDEEPTGNLVPFDGELDEPVDARARFAAEDPRRLDTDEGAERAADAMPRPERSWSQAAGDTVVQLGEGVNTMLGAVPSLVAPESGVAQFFKGNAEHWREQQSDPLKARIASSGRRVEAAGEDGIVAQAKAAASEYWDDPALAARLAVTNIPSMIPALGAGKLTQLAAAARGASAARTASLATTAAGTVNAAMNAGGARGESFDELKAAHMKAGLSEADATEAALSGSMLPAAVGGAAGFVSGKIGLEKALLGQGAGRALGRASGATLAELAGEQLEEVAPQIAGNLQLGKVDGKTGLLDNVGRTVVETGIASAPGAALAGGASMRDTSPEAMLADAINNTNLPAADISDALRTDSMTGYITPEATAKAGIDKAQADADTIGRVREGAEAAVDQLKAEAVGDIGRAGSVDEAIASATRAVNLDSDKMLDAVLAATGIDRAEMDAQQAAAKAAVQQGSLELEALAAAREAAAAVPIETAPVESDSTSAPEKVWYGRRGNGYVTAEDAGKALAERQKINRGLEWTIEQSGEGRYYLAGRAVASQAGAGGPINMGPLPTQPAGRSAAPATMPETQGQTNGSPDQLAARAAESLAQAIRASDPSQGAITVVDGRAGAELESTQPAGVRAAVQAASWVGDATEAAFGWRAIPVTGLKGSYGAQYAGNLFIDVGNLARGDKAGNSVRTLTAANIGHEISHQLEKSADPEDRAAFGRLKAVVMEYARKDAVDARVEREGNGRLYGENEVVADVNGAMWLDPAFWRRVYELDNGSTFRRLAYKAMEVGTKLLDAVKKGSRWDANTWVSNVDAVREVAAQVWAEKGQRENLWSNQRSNDERQKVSRSIEDVSDAVPGQDADEARGERGRRAQDGEVQGTERALPGYAHGHIQGAAGPDQRLVEVAERYARENGIDYARQARYAEIDPEFSRRIAVAYEAMPHAPNDPAVKDAYQNLIRQTTAQYEALVGAGYKFWFIDLEQNADYATSPWNAMRDLRQNQSMGVFPTADGFGSTDFDPADNPLLAETGLSWPVGGPSGEKMAPVYANDLFRAVHDAFGHGLEGAGFRAQGEENAWQAHARMFTGSAIGALTSETRGQNSFLNFGPHGQANRSAKAEDTIFADQKTGLMPEWTWRRNFDDGTKGQSNFEVAPNPNDAELSEKWNDLPLGEKLSISREVADAVVPRVLALSGAQGVIAEQTGSYLGDTNPSFALRLQGGDLDSVSRHLGYVLSQDSMMNLSPSPFDGSVAGQAVIVEMGDASFDEVKQAYDAIRTAVPEVSGQSTAAGEMTILFTDPVDIDALATKISDALGDQRSVSTKEVYYSFPTKDDYNYASSTNDTGAREALAGELRQGLGDLRAEASRLIRERISFSAADDGPADRGSQASDGNGEQEGRNGVDRGQPERASGRGAGGVSGGDGNTLPAYGSPIEHATSVVGYHYSKQPRERLNGAYYGTGLKGLEAERLAGRENDDIRPRIFFYVDAGNGIRPEAGVGGSAHHVRLDNLYDITADPLGLKSAASKKPGNFFNNFERVLMEGGFDGYVIRDSLQPQHYAVLVGRNHQSVPVAKADPPLAKNVAPRTTMPRNEEPAKTRREGDTLVRKPVGDELLQVVKARGDIEYVAPSFAMKYGEARVLASEAPLVNQLMKANGSTFAFDEGVSRSFADDDELGSFNIDAQMDDIFTEEMTDEDWQAALQAEMDAEIGPAPSAYNMPSAEEIKDAGLMAESAFELDGLFAMNDRGRLSVVNDPDTTRVKIDMRDLGDSYSVQIGPRAGSGVFMTAKSDESAKAITKQQVSGQALHDSGFDIASTYRKGTIMKLASEWGKIAGKANVFRSLMPTTKSADFDTIAKEMGAFKGYTMENYGHSIEWQGEDGHVKSADINDDNGEITACTMGLADSKLGPEFYSVVGVMAKNAGKRFKSDSYLSGINSYRRTEQAFSFALKSGDTGVLLPGAQNRVYGYNHRPKTKEDHAKNLARLALAGLRNVQEAFPEVRRLRYDAASDKFTDARGKDAEDVVSKAIADPMAREFGLGRTTIARAVITGQIISGDTASLDVNSFAKPVAYSMMDVELDKPLGEAWGDEGGLQALNPNLRRFIAGSKVVNEDGTPKVMYHGTARDIHAFRAKQAGAIFVTDNPRFAEDFAWVSQDWMASKWREVIPQAQHGEVMKAAAKAVMADKSKPMTQRREARDRILSDGEYGSDLDYIQEAARHMMPSGPNIMPVFVRATAPFDYQRQSDIDDVVFTLMDGNDSVKTNGAERSESEIRELLKSGSWEAIESPEVQDVIRRLGYDSFYVKENGQRNLAVYDPTSIKSVFNRGTYSLDDERISFSALDDYIAREGKRMPLVSPQSELDAAIDLSVKAIDAAMRDITSKSPTMPVPIGRVPHALTMLGAPNQVLRIDSSILRKVLVDKHSEDFAGISTRQFVEAIYKPALVLKAGKEMEIVTDILTKNGPVIVPVMFDSSTSGGAKSAAVMSAYARPVSGKSGIRSRIDAGNLVYADMLKAPSALTGRAARSAGIIASGETPPASLRAGFPSAVPPKGVVASSSPAPASSGINNLGAQFLRSTPAAPGLSIVNQNELQGKPLNPNYAGWSNVKDKILDGIAGRRVKTDVDLVGWIGGNYKGDIEDAPSFSRIQGSRFTLEEETRGQKLRRRMQDYFLRSLVVQNAVAEQGGTVNEQTNFYLAEELSHGRRGALMKDFAEGTVQPMMEKAVKMGVELEELSLYAYAKHAPERNAYIASINPRFPDGGSGMTNAEAAAIIAQVQQEGRAQAFEDLHADLMGITSANRRVMLDEGLITQAEYDAMESAYENYIPLRGFEVVDEKGVTTGRSAGKGFNIRGKETVRALGRKSRAGQLIENAIGDYQRTVDRSERNHVAKVFLNFVLQNPDPELWEIDAAKTRQAMNNQTGQVGVNKTIDKGEDTISVKIAGREVYIKIKDDLLARAMRKAHKDETGDTERFLMRTAGVYTSLLRNTLTRYNPEFAITNSARDYGFGVAAMLDVLGEKGAAKFTANYPGAIAAAFRDETGRADPTRGGWDRWFKEYEMAGGVTSGFYVKDLEQISGDIRGMLIDAGSPRRGLGEHLAYNQATKFVKLAGRVLEMAGAVSENAARVAAYRAAREMGKTAAEAASIAKNLTTNFDRKGELGQLTNAFYVFYNAAVQGSHRIAVMMKNKKVWAYMGGLTSASIMLALASVAWGGDDEDDGIAYWDKIPGYIKERNIIIMLPPGDQMEGAERVGSKGRYISIPIQYGLNWFSAVGYTIADVIRWSKNKAVGKSPLKGAVEMASITAGAFNPFGGAVDLGNGSSVAQAVLPSMADVVVQLSTGTNGFGRNVAPFKSPFDTKPDSENYNLRQADGTAHKVARWLNSVSGGSEHESGGIDLAPGTVENVWRNLTGGTGQFIYDGVNLASRTIERQMGGDPDIFTRDIPLLRRVYGETGGDVDQGIFYENRKKTEEAAGVVKRKTEAGVEPTEEQAAFAGLNKPAGQITRDLAKIRRQMIEVKQDASISEGEKTLRTRELRAARDRLTAEFNRAFKEVLQETHAN